MPTTPAVEPEGKGAAAEVGLVDVRTVFGATRSTAFRFPVDTANSHTSFQLLEADVTRRTLILQNLGPSACFFGPSSVTVDNGYQFATGAEKTIDYGGELWVVAATGSPYTLLMWALYS